MPDTMYEYYLEQSVLPTHGGFRSKEELRAYNIQRQVLFTEKLFLPPALFRGARMIEFGPDSGENALVFAQWGCDCTLVEPNLRAHPFIKKYFDSFELSERLVELCSSDLREFSGLPRSSEKYDFIDAEGFIYTVRPESVWIDLFNQLLNPDGFIILFYVEAFGSFMELLLKAIHTRVCQLTGWNAFDAAQKLYEAKWDSIPHKRSMESWVMDVMENPFVRLRYFFEPQSLCRQMHESGFYLYSSWPPYKDGLNVSWFKKMETSEEILHSQNKFISRSRLSHLFGRTHFLAQQKPLEEEKLWTLLTLIDELIDEFTLDRSLQCIDHLSGLEELIGSLAVIAEPEDTIKTLQLIESVRNILRLLASGEVDELIRFCNTDQAFIQTWGAPAHFAVFRKRCN